MIEAAARWAHAGIDAPTSLRQHDQWHKGDGAYGDGPRFIGTTTTASSTSRCCSTSSMFRDNRLRGPSWPRVERQRRYAAVLERSSRLTEASRRSAAPRLSLWSSPAGRWHCGVRCRKVSAPRCAAPDGRHPRTLEAPTLTPTAGCASASRPPAGCSPTFPPAACISAPCVSPARLPADEPVRGPTTLDVARVVRTAVSHRPRASDMTEPPRARSSHVDIHMSGHTCWISTGAPMAATA
jgi:hypothetical protein